MSISFFLFFPSTDTNVTSWLKTSFLTEDPYVLPNTGEKTGLTKPNEEQQQQTEEAEINRGQN